MPICYKDGRPGWLSRYTDSLRARRSAPIQTTALGHTQLPAIWVPGLFPGVKRSGRGVNHPHPSSTEVKERVEVYLYSPSGPSWPVVG